MAEIKLSDLTAGSTPDGTETLEAVQSSNSVKLTINQILASTGGVSNASTLNIGSGGTIAGTFVGLSGASITGGVSTASFLEVGSGSTIAGILTTLSSVSVASGVTIAGGVTTTGIVQMQSAVTVTGRLTNLGGVSTGSFLEVASGSTIAGTLIGLSGASITGGVSINSDLVVGGLFNAAIKEIVKSTTATLTVAEISGTMINNQGQTTRSTLTLSSASPGYNFITNISTSGVSFNIKADTNDKIYLDGTALDDADKVSNNNPSVGDFATFWTFKSGSTTYDWQCSVGNGTWTDGGG